MGIEPGLSSYCAVILAGGRSVRLGGVDKASIEINGRTLLDRSLDAVIDAAEVVVVGQPVVPTEHPVTFTVEDPAYGGPASGLLSGIDILLRTTPTLAVMAVDMPYLTSATFRRLHEAAVGHDGAMLIDPTGRRQLTFVVDRVRLLEVAPDYEGRHNLPIHRLLDDLDLVDVPSEGSEHLDIDSWADLRDQREQAGPV